jgi:hypothetical protein
LSFRHETTLAGHARAAVDLKAHMAAYCRGAAGRELATAFADTPWEQVSPGGRPSPDLTEAVDRLTSAPGGAESADVVAQGLSDAVDHATARVRMRLVRQPDGTGDPDPGALAAQAGIPLAAAERVAAGQLDTAAGACLDFEHSPFTPSGPCAVSLLMCFACPNALATDRHLPRILYLHETLTGLRSAADPGVWAIDWAAHHARTTDLLDAHTSPAERPSLRARVSDTDRALVDAMLDRRLDR